MGLVIIDKSPISNVFSKDFIKSVGRFVFNKSRGPQALIKSLLRGLDELDYKYRYNPGVKHIYPNDTLYVTGSIAALKYAIKLKNAGGIKKIIAGPTLVVTPNDQGGIIKDKNIDIFLVPSLWVKNAHNLFGDDIFKSKLCIWAAGVSLPNIENDIEKKLCLVYKKNIKENIFNQVICCLKDRNIPYQIIYYGKYKKNNYYDLLKKSSFMIYLQKSESQGIALLEAWAHDVPTLVWDGGEYLVPNSKEVISGLVSAPYLTNECGLFFKDEKIGQTIDLMLKNLNIFEPRKYVKNNFTNKICAQNFLNMIKAI